MTDNNVAESATVATDDIRGELPALPPVGDSPELDDACSWETSGFFAAGIDFN